MWSDEKKKTLRNLIEDAPKTLSKDYLHALNNALFHQNLEPDIDIETIISSLLLIITDSKSPVSSRHFASAILQKLSPIKSVTEVLTLEIGHSLAYAFPVLLVQDLSDVGLQDIIRKLNWCLCNGNWPVEFQCHLLSFISKVISSPKSPLTQDDLKKISSCLSEWLITPVAVPAKSLGFRKSSSSISIAEFDGADMQDFITVLSPASWTDSYQSRCMQAFSMLKSFLIYSSESSRKETKQAHSFAGSIASETLCLSIREYCMRIIDQTDRSAQSVTLFQKACLVEAIDLFNIICLMDSGIVHSIFPVIRRIYDHVYSSASNSEASSSRPLQSPDVSVMASAMRFFMNHGSSVMHKPDNLYVYLFCDLLSNCYQDNHIAFEIIHLMKEHLSQLCYHSSILEKYFPVFFKVLAWRPNTFLEDFMELLPAFMSQHTSLEVFYMLLDLPCLTAILILTESRSNSLDPKILKDPALLKAFKNPETASMIKFMLRKNSGIGDTFENVGTLHQALSSVVSHAHVTCCAEAVVQLLKRYFAVLLQYADMSVAVLLIPAVLERISLIYPVPKYEEAVHNVLADAVVQVFELHPETIFHCQESIINYISHLKNYFIAELNFIHMVWIVGEYVSVTYSSACRPELIALFFESLESTTYEALSSLQNSSDDLFLKLLNVSLTTLSKLASRNQDQVPRAVLCLSKAHQQLSLFGNDYKKTWKIAIERVLELLSILNSPNVAAIVLSPPKRLDNGRLHRDSTSLPYVLRAITGIVTADS